MAEKLCQLKKKGDSFVKDNFNIWVYGELRDSGTCSGGTFISKEKLFPKYTQIKYEKVTGTIRNVQIRDDDMGSSSDYTLSTSWQNIPSSYMSGSGAVRFQVSTATHASTANVKILLK